MQSRLSHHYSQKLSEVKFVGSGLEQLTVVPSQPCSNILAKFFYEFQQLFCIFSRRSSYIVILNNVSLCSTGIEVIGVFFSRFPEY